MIDDNLLKQSIEKWGAQAQKIMAIEECGELIASMSQHLRARNSNVIEEIADVTIMMRQMSLIFGTEQVNEIINQKLNRLKGRLKNGS